MAKASSTGTLEPNIHPRGSAAFFVDQLDKLEDQVIAGKITPKKALEQQAYWKAQAKDRGVDLAHASRSQLEPIRRFLADPSLLHRNEEELLEIRESIDAAEELGAEEVGVKKKWIRLIDEALALQAMARRNPVYMTIYVVRCQQTNKVLTMEKIHVDIFREWNDPDIVNSLQEAPPGVGKTTCLYGQDLYEMGHNTDLRFLKMCSDLKTAKKRLEVTRMYIMSPLYLALFPTIEINAELPNNSEEFTLVRENIGSQDPTMKAAGATSSIQGAGYDREDFDDLCDPKVRFEAATRDKIWKTFHSVALTRRRDFMNARVRYICTPWHVDDCAGRLMEAIRMGKIRRWSIKLYPVEEDEQGNPLPPINRPGYIDELTDMKATDPTTYACCCRLNPNQEDLRMLRRLVFYDESGGQDPLCPDDQRKKWGNLLAHIVNGEQWYVIDPAAGGADQTGAVAFSIGVRGMAAVVAADFFRGRSTEVIGPIVNRVAANKADRVLIEAQGGTKGQADLMGAWITEKLGPAYRDRLRFSGTRMRSGGKNIGQNIAKVERWRNVLPYLEDGTVMFAGRWEKVGGVPKLTCSADPNIKQLHDQLVNYPNVTRDDGLDCMSLFINYNLDRLVRRVRSMAQPRERAEPLAPTTNPLTLLRRALEAKRLNALNEKRIVKGARWHEMDLLSAG